MGPDYPFWSCLPIGTTIRIVSNIKNLLHAHIHVTVASSHIQQSPATLTPQSLSQIQSHICWVIWLSMCSPAEFCTHKLKQAKNRFHPLHKACITTEHLLLGSCPPFSNHFHLYICTLFHCNFLAFLLLFVFLINDFKCWVIKTLKRSKDVLHQHCHKHILVVFVALSVKVSLIVSPFDVIDTLIMGRVCR